MTHDALRAPSPPPRRVSENPEIPLSSERIGELFDGASTTAGLVVTEKKALGIPAVWRAVNLIDALRSRRCRCTPTGPMARYGSW